MQEATPRTTAHLALLLSAANPKVLLRAVAAGLDIGSAGYGSLGDVAAEAVFTVVAGSA